MLDNAILEVVKADLEAGRVTVLDDLSACIAALERGFPMTSNRIAWENVPEAQRIEVFSVGAGELHADAVERQLEGVRAPVGQWFRRAGISSRANAAWLGDGTDIGLEVAVGYVLEKFPALFAFPQHSYVVSSDGAWCLNYVMEGELFFSRCIEG